MVHFHRRSYISGPFRPIVNIFFPRPISVTIFFFPSCFPSLPSPIFHFLPPLTVSSMPSIRLTLIQSLLSPQWTSATMQLPFNSSASHPSVCPPILQFHACCLAPLHLLSCYRVFQAFILVPSGHYIYPLGLWYLLHPTLTVRPSDFPIASHPTQP